MRRRGRPRGPGAAAGTGRAGSAGDPPNMGTAVPQSALRRNFRRGAPGVEATAPDHRERQNTGRSTAGSHHQAAPDAQEFRWHRSRAASGRHPVGSSFLGGTPLGGNPEGGSRVRQGVGLCERGVPSIPALPRVVDTRRRWATFGKSKRRVFSQGSGVSRHPPGRRSDATSQHSSRAGRRPPPRRLAGWRAPMTGAGTAASWNSSVRAVAAAALSKSASIRFRMTTVGSSEFPFARFGMGLAYSFSGTTPAPAGGSVNEEKSA